MALLSLEENAKQATDSIANIFGIKAEQLTEEQESELSVVLGKHALNEFQKGQKWGLDTAALAK